MWLLWTWLVLAAPFLLALLAMICLEAYQSRPGAIQSIELPKQQARLESFGLDAESEPILTREE